MRHPFRLLQIPVLLGGALAAALLGCHDSNDSGSGTSQVRVMLTDAPADYIKSAVVTISRVYLVPGDDESQSVDLDREPRRAFRRRSQERAHPDVLLGRPRARPDSR